MVNISFPNVTLNNSNPFPVADILNNTIQGNIASVFVTTNANMSYMPMRLIMVCLFVVFYALIKKLDPSTTKLKALSVSSIIVATSIGILAFIPLLELTDALIFIVIAVITAWFNKRESG